MLRQIGFSVLTVGHLLGLFLAYPGGVRADLFFRYLPHPPPAAGEIYDNLDVYVSGGKVLMTGQSRSGVSYSAWYDSAAATFRVHDVHRDGYYVLKPGDLAAVQVQHGRFRRDMERKLADTADAEKQAMRQALEQFESGLYGGPPPDVFEYRKRGGLGSEAGVDCVEYDALHRGDPVRLLCLSEFDSLGARVDDIATLESMHTVAAEIAFGTRIGFQLIPVFPLDLANGLPVRIRYLDSGTELRLSQVLPEVPENIQLDSFRQHTELSLQPRY